MRTNNFAKLLESIGVAPLGCRSELAEAMVEYALLVALITATAIGFITAFGSEISLGSTAIATEIFGAG